MFAVLRPVSQRKAVALWVAAFVLPLLVWSAFSYVPFLWHPLVRVGSPGDVSWFKPGLLVDRAVFAEENTKAVVAGGRAADGIRANPVFLPAPHEVARAFYTAFNTKPLLRGDLWLHESLALSIKTIVWGFLLSSLIGVPLGILCGAYAPIARSQHQSHRLLPRLFAGGNL